MTNRKGVRYKTISPRQLEKYAGDFVGRAEPYWLEGKAWEPLAEWFRLENTVDGEYCLTDGPYGNMKVRLRHGDMISTWREGDCIFIDDSD